MIRLVICTLVLMCPFFNRLHAESASLFVPGSTGTGFVKVTQASLFAGRDVGLLARTHRPDGSDPARRTDVSRLLDIIALAEAGPRGYDAVQHGARVAPPGRPTDLTLAQIHDWIRATPGQPHAIGRYQFIPSTLRWLGARAGLSPDTRFTPAIQDRLAGLLLDDAGLRDFRNGTLGRDRFMDNLARIWAGLPLATGKSAYEGVAGNTATLSRAAFHAHMTRVFGLSGA